MKYLFYILLTAIIGFSVFKGVNLHKIQKEQTLLKEDWAEIHKINYGLFNVELWKEKALSIFDGKIKDFKIDPKMYKDVNRQLVVYLNEVYDEYFTSGKLADEFLAQAEKKGTLNKMFINMIKGSVKDLIKDFDLKSKIPSIANELTSEIKSNEHVFKGYLTKELNAMLFDASTDEYKDPREPLLLKYQQEELTALGKNLTNEILTNDQEINTHIKWIYGLLILALLLTAISFKWIGLRTLVMSFTIVSIVMLLLGISLPMIDIDARLNSFEFSILGSQIDFDEQVLYFQSKSITDVTSTLMQSRGIDMKIVGALVFLFSIVFPFFKLLLSSLYLFVEKIRVSKIANTVIFYLGKWSMADVFVVAIFMAYIGFYGITSAQLNDIASGQGNYQVQTVNYSKLSPGALFFTSYCVLSIITSIIIDRVKKNADQTS